MMQTREEIHGHEVLEMMVNAGRPFSRASLIEAIDRQFGETARFFICSGGGMTSAELVDTLAAKGKFTGSAEAFVFNPAMRCNH